MNTLPIYCINLDEATDRWSRVQHRLAAYGLDARRWSASTSADVTASSKAFAPAINDRQRACALSHYLLWEHCLQQEHTHVLILEDDAVFRKDWVSVIDAQLTQPAWAALFLNVSEDVPQHNQWVSCRRQCLTGAAIYTHDTLLWLVSVFRQTLYASDWMTQILQEHLPCLTYFPWLVIQEGVDSYIQEGVPKADLAKVHRLLSEASYGLENYDL